MQNPQASQSQWFAAVLAYLVPGLGHFYLGKTFKAALYFVCIMGTYLYGMAMADWKPVYYPFGDQADRAIHTYGFWAQAGVGSPAIIAFAQSKRFERPGNSKSNSLTEPLTAPFTGEITREMPDRRNQTDECSGQLSIEPVEGVADRVRGRFVGTTSSGEALDLQIEGIPVLGRPISADSRREFASPFTEERDGKVRTGDMVGTIPRSFWNWFAVPPTRPEFEELVRRLGKRYELALVFTWIAGLLNVLAVWDALDGPAYGYGDEDEDQTDKPVGGGSEETKTLSAGQMRAAEASVSRGGAP